jgi:hypothetical protein
MGRSVAIIALVLFLALGGSLLSIPFWIGGGVQQLSIEAPVTFRKEIGDTKIEGTLAINEKRSFVLLLSAETGAPNALGSLPTVVFNMTEHPMPPLKPTVERLSGPRFAARGLFSMSGRWQLQVILPHGKIEIPFILLSPDRRP